MWLKPQAGAPGLLYFVHSCSWVSHLFRISCFGLGAGECGRSQVPNPEWNLAQPATDFIQNDPLMGEPWNADGLSTSVYSLRSLSTSVFPWFWGSFNIKLLLIKGLTVFLAWGFLLWYVDCLGHRKFFNESLRTGVDTVLLGRAGVPPLDDF